MFHFTYLFVCQQDYAKTTRQTFTKSVPEQYNLVPAHWLVPNYTAWTFPKKTWWDCVKNDMESLDLSRKVVQSRNKWRRRIKGATATD